MFDRVHYSALCCLKLTHIKWKIKPNLGKHEKGANIESYFDFSALKKCDIQGKKGCMKMGNTSDPALPIKETQIIQRHVRARNLYSMVFWDNVEKIVDRRHDLSWADISRYLGTDRTTIASMRTRRSRLSLDTVIHISEILNVPVEDLLKKDGVQNYHIDRMELSEEEYQLLMDYRVARNRKRGNAARNIIFTVLSELKNL